MICCEEIARHDHAVDPPPAPRRRHYETDLIVGDRFEKMVASAAAGTMPDIGMSTPYQVQELGLKGVARAHDDFMKQSRQKQNPTSNGLFIDGAMGYYFATFTERKSKEFLGSPSLKFNFTPWPIPKGGRRINFGGNHTYFVTTGSKSPDVAWKFLEFLAQDDIILRFTKRYDRIPVKVKVAEGHAYQENDPFLKLAVEEMRVRKFHVPAPGGGEIQAIQNRLAIEAVSGQRPIREVLRDYSTQMQQALDKFKQ